MKVKELIEILQKHGQEAEVSVYNDDRDEGIPSLEPTGEVTCDGWDGNQDVHIHVYET